MLNLIWISSKVCGLAWLKWATLGPLWLENYGLYPLTSSHSLSLLSLHSPISSPLSVTTVLPNLPHFVFQVCRQSKRPRWQVACPRGTSRDGKAAAELPAPVKLSGLVSSSRGKSEQGPATRSLGNACTKIQLIKSASYLFHGHFHLGHCRRDLFTAGNQQQRVIQQGKLKLSWRHWPVATDTSYTHTRGTHPTAEVSGATHTTSDSKYVSCPSDLLLYLLPLAARSPKADHVLASQLSGSKHFALLKCPLEAGLSGMRTCVQCKAAGMAQTSCSCENTQFTNCLNMAVR